MPLALLSNWRAMLGGAVFLLLALAIGVQTMRLSWSQAEVVKYQGVVAMLQETIGELHGAISRQNTAQAEYKRKSDDATKASQAALQAAERAHDTDATRITALLARKAALTLEAACKAADDAILEIKK